MELIIVICNCDNTTTAKSIARSCVQQNLSACVNIIPSIFSVYKWQGNIEEATECTLLIKTIKKNVKLLEQHILEQHPYDIAEIIQIQPEDCNSTYYQWMTESLRDER